MFTPGTYERDMDVILKAIAVSSRMSLTVSIAVRRPIFYLFDSLNHTQRSYSTPAELMQGMGLRSSAKKPIRFDAESFEWLLDWLMRNPFSTISIHSQRFLKPFRTAWYNNNNFDQREDFEATNLTELADLLKVAEIHEI